MNNSKSRFSILSGLAFILFASAATLFLASCAKQTTNNKPPNVDYYTCTMHPSVHSEDPDGHCPICGMGLVPVMKKGATNGAAPGQATTNSESASTNASIKSTPTEFVVPVARQQQIGVTYAKVETCPLKKSIRAVGTVTYEKQQQWNFVARVDGYIQKLEVSSRGDQVEKGQALMSIYSPDLLTTQNELLDLYRLRDEAVKSGSAAARQSFDSLIESARRRLIQWNVSPEQIRDLEQSRKAVETLTLYSPFKGVVQDLPVEQGRRVAVGDLLVGVTDLSTVWVWAEFYQDEFGLLTNGMPVAVTSAAIPGKVFPGVINVIDPFINPATRTARVRLQIQNPDFKLRPDMYVNVQIDADAGNHLAIPTDAVMPTGSRNVVFVDKGDGRLEPRFIELGGKFGPYYAVAAGLTAGERVVTSANFLIDAEAQVQGALKSWQE